MTERVTANLGIAIQAAAFFLAWSSRVLAPGAGNRFTMPSTARLGVTAALVFCAGGLFVWAWRSLGPQWSIQARTLPDHHLVTTGPYGRVRHPIYLAVGLFLVAVGVVAATWWAFIAAIALYSAGASLRIRSEEHLLASRFGDEFERYRRRVPSLLPRLPTA